jgi:fructose-1,6-bisphosphatase/inositol monophosphatase family enzyme
MRGVLRGAWDVAYELVVGDDWRIAAGVVLVLALGAVVVARRGADLEWLAPLLVAGVAAAFALCLVREVRR